MYTYKDMKIHIGICSIELCLQEFQRRSREETV